jgi:hypothetical protein
LCTIFLATYGPELTARLVQETFAHNIGRLLSDHAASDMEPEESACIIAMRTIGAALQTLTQDKRDLVLFALQTGNQSENITTICDL